MTTKEITFAYRRLYQHGLRAVQYAKPQRFTLRNRLRQAFRKTSREEFDQARIDKTLEFLNGAAREKGLEHKILKNLLHVWWNQEQPAFPPPSNKYMWDELKLRRTSYDHFNHTLRLMNGSMGTCFPA
ncbi:DUF1763-domain-containing protein [Viridothelium virens]|uniref:DUF1763-domain-containing protein n=1 Tax=Viridothelium virens TaxID=1048519 RepID=A0A6A6GSK2_VIRVR|nr:DUF1763-domain-containing protein [Viridothelium virens]